MPLYKAPLENDLSTTLSSGIGAADTSLTAGTDLEAKLQVPLLAVIDRVDSSGETATPENMEYIKVTAVSGTAWSGITRGLGGTTAQAHSADAIIEFVWDIEQYNELYDVITAEHGTDGTHSADSVDTTQLVDASVTAAKVADDVFEKIYPVGSIYISTVATNPATLFGIGTWATFGAGKTLVGLDSGDTDFDTVEETGGAKTHTLTTSEMPAHTHSSGSLTTNSTGSHRHDITTWAGGVNASGDRVQRGAVSGTSSTNALDAGGNSAVQADGNHSHSISGSTGSAGSGNAHNNLPPYLVTYMFKRTA